MNAAAEPISITNSDGIIFLWCAPCCFLHDLFLISLTHEGRSRQPQDRLHLVVATSFEPEAALEDTVPGFVVGSIRIPMTLLHTNIATRKPLRLHN